MTTDTRPAFTPGPWFVVGPLTEEESGVPGGFPVTVEAEAATEAEFQPHDGETLPTVNILDDLTEADAHLIAASPELYEALRQLVGHHERTRISSHDGKCDWIDAGRAALAKAEGR